MRIGGSLESVAQFFSSDSRTTPYDWSGCDIYKYCYLTLRFKVQIDYKCILDAQFTDDVGCQQCFPFYIVFCFAGSWYVAVSRLLDLWKVSWYGLAVSVVGSPLLLLCFFFRGVFDTATERVQWRCGTCIFKNNFTPERGFWPRQYIRPSTDTLSAWMGIWSEISKAPAFTM